MIEHQIGNSNKNFHYNAYVYENIFYNSHFHSSYELIYTIDGYCEITVNEKFYEIKKGEMLLISPYTVHSINISPGNKTWVGVFSDDFIPDFAEKNKYKKYEPFCSKKETEDFLLKNLFFQGKPDHYMLISCLYMVCSECVKKADFHDTALDKNFINSVIEYISQNLSDNITLSELSRKLGYEYHYFSMLFNRCFSTNFKNFINMLRFQQACKLILNKNITITDISHSCGFGSIRNFNRVFKSMSGYTPTEYRKLSLM